MIDVMMEQVITEQIITVSTFGELNNTDIFKETPLSETHMLKTDRFDICNAVTLNDGKPRMFVSTDKVYKVTGSYYF